MFAKTITTIYVSEPNQPFRAYLTVKNTGSNPWEIDKNYSLKFVSGDDMGVVEVPFVGDRVLPEGKYDWELSLWAPKQPARYISYWRMSHDNELFGDVLSVILDVKSATPECQTVCINGYRCNTMTGQCYCPSGIDCYGVCCMENQHCNSQWYGCEDDQVDCDPVCENGYVCDTDTFRCVCPGGIECYGSCCAENQHCNYQWYGCEDD